MSVTSEAQQIVTVENTYSGGLQAKVTAIGNPVVTVLHNDSVYIDISELKVWVEQIETAQNELIEEAERAREALEREDPEREVLAR